jgi:hypothetical protein
MDLREDVGHASQPALHVLGPPIDSAGKASHEQSRHSGPVAGRIDREQLRSGHLDLFDELQRTGFALGQARFILVDLGAHVAAQHGLVAPTRVFQREDVHGRRHAAAQGAH